MTNSTELLTKIAALRQRLDRIQAAPAAGAKTQDADEPSYFTPAAAPPRLTFRAAQLLKDSRAVLTELKEIEDDPIVQLDASVAQNLQREAAGMLDVILRNLLAVPAGAAGQLRHCEGLQSCLNAAREKMHLLQSSLAEERREDQRIELLATILRRLAGGETADLASLIDFAQPIADDAIQGAPLRFRSSPKNDVARFAAHHGLAVARVQAWVLRGEVPQRQRLAELLVPALVHDVGMLSISPSIVFKPEPLNETERAAIKRHPLEGRLAIERLYPGGGAPVEAVADHHERLDGSGYPSGKTSLDIGDSARLLAACDIYAALASPRPHRSAADARTALADTLLLADQGVLDRAQTEKLLRLTFYPAGAVVQLSDGTVALVVGTPKAMINPAKATVIPLRTAAGEAPAYPWPIDLAESSSLNILRALTAAERARVLGRTHPSLV